jgi:hypothetical protein
MERLQCDGMSPICPGPCNPYHRLDAATPGTSETPFKQTIFNRNIYNKHEFSLFCKNTQTDDEHLRPGSSALSSEDRKFIEELKKRIENRRRGQFINRQYIVQKFITFVIFLCLHSFLAIFTKNYEQYQTFLATQFCGFITIMFWDTN